ncbi:MAG: alpha/beta hydrolase [Alistipes sp.]|jgi:dienelactone hydrolase|nr:alpha/beta hydrolase [Alistipes sp.]
MRKIFTLFVALVYCATVTAQNTYLFAERDGEKLYLDHYTAVDTESLRPCVIFAFGGAFARGTRADEGYLPYFKALTEAGYDVVSIDYRKHLAKGINTEGLKGAVVTMKNAVEYAAQDMLSATAFVLKNAEQWSINTQQIVACGSSAGAITALQAENMICNGDKAAQELGEFNYAGVVSFAGAIFSVSGKPKWQKSPCPVMLFHGNADSNVPYKKASAFGVGFYGSEFLVGQFEKMDTPYWFYSAQYRNHAMAGDPMYVNVEEIKAFINRVVVKGEKLQIVQSVVDAKHPKTKTRFSVKEYLGSNYSK